MLVLFTHNFSAGCSNHPKGHIFFMCFLWGCFATASQPPRASAQAKEIHKNDLVRNYSLILYASKCRKENKNFSSHLCIVSGDPYTNEIYSRMFHTTVYVQCKHRKSVCACFSLQPCHGTKEGSENLGFSFKECAMVALVERTPLNLRHLVPHKPTIHSIIKVRLFGHFC